MLIRHGGFLTRDDFTCYTGTFASFTGSTPLAVIDWDTLHEDLHNGRLPLSGGERRFLTIAASLAAGYGTCLRTDVPGLDIPSTALVTAAIRHAAGQHDISY
jgi:ABC-type phosphate transport system ATPase subunit